MKSWKLFFISLLMLAPAPQMARGAEDHVNLTGYITDASTDESLIGVTIQNLTANSGTTSNNYGHYTIKVERGARTHLRFSYIGYTPIDTIIVAHETEVLNIKLREEKRLLDELVITGSHTAELNTMETGRVKILGSDIKMAPSFMGENDIIKYVQLLPGVSHGTEGFSGPVVRGGNVDENLYLLDGTPLYNVNHLMGLFSTFNADAIKTANFYKGSFPARFGGRLSSVLDVRMKDGDMQSYHGAFTLGLISSKIHLEGPIVKGKTSFSVSARRSYIDLILRPIVKMTEGMDDSSGDDYKSSTTPGYYFYDINAKLNHIISDKDRIFLSFYTGRDKFDTKLDEWYRESIVVATEEDDRRMIEVEHNSRTSADMSWGNMLVTLGWNHLFSPTLFSNTTLYYGQYLSDIGSAVSEETFSKEEGKVSTYNFNLKINSGIRDIGLRSDFEWRPKNEHYIRFGLDAIMHLFRPTVEEVKISDDEAPEDLLTDNNTTREKRVEHHSKEIALYAEDEMKINDALSANFGARASLLNVEGKSYFSVEPRLSMRYALHPHISLKASYAEMTQYVHLLQSTTISLPTDLWVPVTSKIKPMRSRQAVLGLYWEKNGYEASLEGYYKWLHNQLAYKDGAPMYLSEMDWQERVAIGEGRSYGSELLLRKTTGRLTGWMAYTLSWSDRIYPGGEVNNGIRFRDKYDNRHRLNIVGHYRLSKRFDLSAAWIFSSGNRMTLQSGYKTDINGYETAYVTERNNFQLPDYHRLDLSANFYRFGKKGQEHIWNISIYNAYSHHNSFMVNLEDDQTAEPGEFKKVIRSVSIFPIIPSISYTFKF
ncbi:MAG: TonB-dependent receptor [Porphyromonas sp.]|nr:TonB-dependent receptor [Porphyromonas sp.]